MSSENIQTYETQKHQIISSEPPELSYQVSEKKNKQKKRIKTRTQIHLQTRNRIFQRKHKFSLLKSVIIEREREKKFYVDWAVCNVLGRYLSVFRFLRKRSKWKKTKKKQKKKLKSASSWTLNTRATKRIPVFVNVKAGKLIFTFHLSFLMFYL